MNQLHLKKNYPIQKHNSRHKRGKVNHAKNDNTNTLDFSKAQSSGLNIARGTIRNIEHYKCPLKTEIIDTTLNMYQNIVRVFSNNLPFSFSIISLLNRFTDS